MDKNPNYWQPGKPYILSMAIDRNQIANVAEYGYTKPADVTGLSKDNSYAVGSWFNQGTPEQLIVMTTVKPK